MRMEEMYALCFPFLPRTTPNMENQINFVLQGIYIFSEGSEQKKKIIKHYFSNIISKCILLYLISTYQMIPAKRIAPHLNRTIFEIMNVWSARYKSINLAQGFPDDQPPRFLLENAKASISAGEDQYCQVAGLPLLTEKMAKHYSEVLERSIQPDEVMISSGAQASLQHIFNSYLDVDDEVVVFNPLFQIYTGMIEILGGKIKTVNLMPCQSQNKLIFDKNEFEKAITPKTKILLLNSPHNPTGKVFTEEEYDFIASVIRKNPQVLVLCDDAYECMLFDKKKLARFCKFPGMYERTITIVSWGKTFNATGWRLGVAIGPAPIIKVCSTTQSWTVFGSNRPVMHAWAKSLEDSKKPYEGYKNYYEYLIDVYQKRKDYAVETLEKTKLGWDVIHPEGGYFVMVDISKIKHNIPLKYFYQNNPNIVGTYGESKIHERPKIEFTPDFAFSLWLTIEHGVTPIPLYSSTYPKRGSDADEYADNQTNFVRFALCKSMKTLSLAREALWKIQSNQAIGQNVFHTVQIQEKFKSTLKISKKIIKYSFLASIKQRKSD